MRTVTLLVQASLVFISSTGEKFQIKAAAKPQTAPEWVVNTDTYKAAFKQGMVYAINYVAPPPQPEKKVPANVAVGFGFNQNTAPTMESLMGAGLTMEAAHAALQAMDAAKNPPPPVFEPDVPVDASSGQPFEPTGDATQSGLNSGAVLSTTPSNLTINKG